MVHWYHSVYVHWPLALQLLALVGLGLNMVVALWLFFDVQRYNGRLNPFAWSLGALVCSTLMLAMYWRRTGNPRAALAFGVIMITGLVMTGMYDQPVQQAVDLQVEHTLEQLPVRGISAPH